MEWLFCVKYTSNGVCVPLSLICYSVRVLSCAYQRFGFYVDAMKAFVTLDQIFHVLGKARERTKDLAGFVLESFDCSSSGNVLSG